MREISTEKITEAVKNMCISANCNLNDDVYSALKEAEKTYISEQQKVLLLSVSCASSWRRSDVINMGAVCESRQM